MSYPERIVPDETEAGVVALHLKRYAFAEPRCRDREVLDLACGTGYGSYYLADGARRVLGVDVSEEAIAYARRRYRHENVAFEVMDATQLALADRAFDVVCSFETIEHLPDREAYLREVTRVLRDDGTYVVSTPRAEQTDARPQNPFHHVEYDLDDFQALLERHFDEIELYGQRRLQTRRHRLLQRLDVLGLRRRVRMPHRVGALVGTPPTADLTLDDVVIEPALLEQATELVAVCRRPRRP